MSGAVFINDGQSYLIQVQFTSPDPDKAAVIANKIAERFVDDQLRGKLSATDKATGWLEQRLAELKVEVQKSDQAVAQLQGRATTSSRPAGARSTTRSWPISTAS